MTRRDGQAALIADAVKQWYYFYEVQPDEPSSDVLSRAAIELYAEGYDDSDDIATLLIAKYVGMWSTRVNAPTSASLH